jgi:predicted O-methyltransferase YrrM
MKRLHIVDPYNSVAMRRLSEPLIAELGRLYEVTTSAEIDKTADLNFHMPWHTMAGLTDRGEGKHVIAYTHCNPPDYAALVDACERADAITAMTFTGRNELLELGVDPRKIWTIYAAADQFVYRQRMIAIIGYPQPNGRKREHLLLDLAWQYDMTPYHFVFVGTGWEDMANKLRMLGVNASHAHAVTDQELQALYRSIDLLLVTGYAEGGPLPLLEAMAAGVPVLSPEFGYAKDLLPRYMQYRNADELINCLAELTSTNIFHHKLARAWSWKDYVMEYALIFGRLLGEPVDICPEYGVSRYAQLLDIIDELKPTDLVEIGTWNGNRAIQMIQAAAKYHQPDRITYTGFDLFEGQTAADFRRELSKRGYDMDMVQRRLEATGAKVTLVPGYTRDTLENLREYDLCFVDGGHSEETIEHDGKAALSGLEGSAVVVFDDYYHQGKPEGMGCNTFIDSLDVSQYEITHLPARTLADDGREIGMVKVRLQNANIRIQVRETAYAGSDAITISGYSGLPDTLHLPQVPA